jgi:hypothetical protein
LRGKDFSQAFICWQLARAENNQAGEQQQQDERAYLLRAGETHNSAFASTKIAVTKIALSEIAATKIARQMRAAGFVGNAPSKAIYAKAICALIC